MLNNNASYKYEIQYKGPFVKTQCWTNGMAALKWVTRKIRYNIRCMNPYTSYIDVEDINLEIND